MSQATKRKLPRLHTISTYENHSGLAVAVATIVATLGNYSRRGNTDSSPTDYSWPLNHTQESLGSPFLPVQLDKIGVMGFGATPAVPWDEIEADVGEDGKILQVLHPISRMPRILAFDQHFATTAYAVDREQSFIRAWLPWRADCCCSFPISME